MIKYNVVNSIHDVTVTHHILFRAVIYWMITVMVPRALTVTVQINTNKNNYHATRSFFTHLSKASVPQSLAEGFLYSRCTGYWAKILNEHRKEKKLSVAYYSLVWPVSLNSSSFIHHIRHKASLASEVHLMRFSSTLIEALKWLL